MQLYGSFPEEMRFSKARTAAVWRKSCSLGPFPFPLYLIPAISSAMMNQRLTLHFGILLPRPFTNRKDSLLTIPSNGILFRYDIYWRRTFSRDSFMGTSRWRPFFVLFREMQWQSKSTSMFLIESASPIRIPVLYRVRTIAGIAIRQEEGTFSLSRNESHALNSLEISSCV